MEILLIVAVVVGLFDIAALRWGADSRPGFGEVYGEANPDRVRAAGLV